MAQSKPQVTFGLGYRYDSVYLRDGVVEVQGFDVEYQPVLPPGGGRPTAARGREVAGGGSYVAPAPMFEAMATDPPYDAGELAFSTYVQAIDQGKDFTALPVFTSRYFEHNQLYVNAAAGIQRPTDLEGKRVSTGCFSMNPGVWLRGMLAHQYDVAIEKVTWVENRKEYFPGYRTPRRYTVEKAPEGESIASLIEAGRIDAASRGRTANSPHLKPLFEDPYPEIRNYFRATGIFPINTVVMFPRRTLAKHPALPEALFKAFQQALDLYRSEVHSGARERDHSGLDLLRLERDAGAPLPDHGLRANRQNIRTMVQYCYEQGIIGRLYEPEDLFLSID